MDWVRIEGRVLEFKFDFPKPKQLNDPIEETLNKLNSFNNKLSIIIIMISSIAKCIH